MNLISRQDLKAKLDRGDIVKLVMTMGDWAFQAKHIPGSLNLNSAAEAQEYLKLDDEIVVYCSNEACPASVAAYQMLKTHGYRNIHRYAGGLMDWEDAGYPLEGHLVQSAREPDEPR